MPGPRYVSSIQPSRFDDDRVYVTFDGHRSDDFVTHVYVSEDRGDTWKSLVADLPDEPCHVCREDPQNEDLLFLGTEFSCYVSLDRGEHWMTLGSDLPTVAVRDLAIQDRDSDLVAATHGRGIWIVDIAPLRQLTAKVARADHHLFAPEDAILWRMARRGMMGSKRWRASNPPNGATIYALSRKPPSKNPRSRCTTSPGRRSPASPAWRRQACNGSFGTAAEVTPVAAARRAKAVGKAASGAAGRRSPPLPPGAYSVRLTVGDDTAVRLLTLLPDPRSSTTPAASTPTSRN